MKRFPAIAVVAAGCLAANLTAGPNLVPKDLRCDGMHDPLATTIAPRFSWRAESSARGQAQLAWQILVASNSVLLEKDCGDLWLVDQVTAPADGPRLCTGIFGTNMLLEKLSRHGRSDIACALADRKTLPSWGWMLENNATTPWEHWAGGDDTFSHNHPTLGSISGWFFRWLGGIQPAADAVAFDRILIRPQPVVGLDWVKCSHPTVRGLIESNWELKNGSATFGISIPPDATAIVELPKKPDGTITESGLPLEDSPDVMLLDSPESHQRLQVCSGSYRFQIR